MKKFQVRGTDSPPQSSKGQTTDKGGEGMLDSLIRAAIRERAGQCVFPIAAYAQRERDMDVFAWIDWVHQKRKDGV